MAAVPVLTLTPRYGNGQPAGYFAIYQAGSDGYRDSVLLNGQPTGTPNEALDCVCTLYLMETDDHVQ
ncbi:hypothetical protein FHR32_004729 [Streptosporangium album]|uniref:Uncharacterized protein n=1 Tax=Streptosporangium album TaxID=47479 RepID=A0A7W7WBP2_9ACTN|nr:hypothetical protein [Streptosporangium album]